MAPRRFVAAGLVGIGLLGVIPFGCGNRGTVDGSTIDCTRGQTACLSEQLGQICNAQGQWATFQCSDDKHCDAGACQPLDPDCNAGERECLTNAVSQICTRDRGWVAIACAQGELCSDGDCQNQSSCNPEAHECISDSLQRICKSDGAGWQTSECPADSQCVDGECVGDCRPGASSCATQRLLRTCLPAESKYSERACPVSTICSGGKCVSNSALACNFGQDVCADENTALQCMRDGSGYLVKDCPSGTKCRSGKCWGSVCAAGSTTCVSSGSTSADFIGVQTCDDDGSSYTVEVCKSGGKCVLNQDTGKQVCEVAPCTIGEEVCGDGATGDTSTDQLSRCETLGSGKTGWVTYHCDAPTTCKSTSTTAAACHVECSPGDQRCNTNGTSVDTCSDSGVWESQSCSKGANTQDVCVFVPSTKQAVCGDKDCQTLQKSTKANYYATHGRCLSELIRMCGEDGRLGKASACTDGQCVLETDGFGVCKDPTRCSHDDGWRECIASNDSYRTCMSGHWEFTLCAENEQCTKVGDGLATCGNDCIQGKRRCVDGGYQDCSSDGTWGNTKQCSVGECNPLTNNCEAACAAGQLRCSGDVVVASDGSSLGSRSVQTCSSTLGWSSPVACTGSSLCRRSGMGEHLGCVQCVGPDVSGGNEEGAVDSRCTADTRGYQTCQADNTWPTNSAVCSGTEHCAKQRDGSITGTCSNYGCPTTAGRPKFCVGYETVTTPESIDDCCSGECDSENGQCLHRKRHYDPTCTETSSCFTGRYDSSGSAVNETCCSGFCRSGQGCLKVKAKACDTVTSCEVTKVDHTNICCGTCLASGLCAEQGGASHPTAEYFACGTASNICWGVGSCAWAPASGSSTSGAMFANCIQ